MNEFLWAVFCSGVVVAALGLVALVWFIPFFGQIKTVRVRTEFFAARAAYWCVMAGLAILVIMSVSIAIRLALAKTI